MFNWLLNITPLNNTNNRTMSCTWFLDFLCWLWTYLSLWLSCIVHIFYTYFTNSCTKSCFYCFKQSLHERFSKIKLNRWDKTLPLKLLSKKSFSIKKCFANNNSDSKRNTWNAAVKSTRSGNVINGNKGFRLFCCLKIWQNLNWKSVC